MNIAVNITPLKSAHKNRGIGNYTKNLINNLREDKSIEVTEFTNIKEVQKADIIHYPWFDFYFRTLPIRKLYPTVVTIHDVMPLIFSNHYPPGVRGKINLILQKAALKGCKQIITDSEISKRDVIKYLKIKDNRINVVHLAADERFKVISNDTELLRIKRLYHLPDRFLLYVGDANWVKNLPFLIEGFRHLISVPEFADVKLVLVGGVFLKDVEKIDHPELKSLQLTNNLIKEYKLKDYIIRPGQIETEELVAFYNLATVYVQPSLYEGFGLPVLQAFACGAPVVSSNRGSLPEIGGQAAVYFDPDKLNQFISVVGEILGNSSLRSKLSKLGLKQATKFSWQKVAEETKLVYLKAIKNE